MYLHNFAGNFEDKLRPVHEIKSKSEWWTKNHNYAYWNLSFILATKSKIPAHSLICNNDLTKSVPLRISPTLSTQRLERFEEPSHR